jgi:hypothetical protein
MKIRKKIHLRITGGLGNQIFQYLYALSVAEARNGDCIIHTGHMNRFSVFKSGRKLSAVRHFSLDKLTFFNNTRTVEVHQGKTLFTAIFFGQFRIFRLVFFREIFFRITNNLYLDGYFMSADEYIQIKSMEKIISSELCHQIDKKGNRYCGIHFRAGDLLQQDHPKCSISYFQTAMNMFANSYGVDKFEIITEDIAYASSFFEELEKLFNITFAEPGNEIDDFYRLASYKYLIAANSTFSWWAGALGHSHSFVCTPFLYTDGDKPIHSKEICIPH